MGDGAFLKGGGHLFSDRFYSLTQLAKANQTSSDVRKNRNPVRKNRNQKQCFPFNDQINARRQGVDDRGTAIALPILTV